MRINLERPGHASTENISILLFNLDSLQTPFSAVDPTVVATLLYPPETPSQGMNCSRKKKGFVPRITSFESYWDVSSF